MTRTTRRVATPILAAAALLLTSACGAGFTAQTNLVRGAQDGVSATQGSIALRNVLLVAPQGGGSAALVAGVTTTSTTRPGSGTVDQLLAVRTVGVTTTSTFPAGGFPVPADGLLAIGSPSGAQVTFRGSAKDLAPGRFLPLEFVFEKAGVVRLDVLIVPAVGAYATVTPQPTSAGTAATPTPSGGVGGAGAPAGTPTGTRTPSPLPTR